MVYLVGRPHKYPLSSTAYLRDPSTEVCPKLSEPDLLSANKFNDKINLFIDGRDHGGWFQVLL